MNNIPNTAKSNAKDSKLASIKKKYLLKITDEVKEPPICLSIVQDGKETIFGTLGNFSVISGKPKSRKTFFVSALAGATLVNNKTYLNIKQSFPKDKKKILYFDTEQGNFHARRVIKRVHKIAEMPKDKHSDLFQYYLLKTISAKQRLEIIDTIIMGEKNIGLVVIDGIRDLVTSINDEKEATLIATYLMKWAGIKNIHIINVLHQNKGDTNIRGHLGSELENKAESVISIVKFSEDDNFSSIEPKSMRDTEFKKYSFAINDDNILYEVENPENGGGTKQPKHNEYTDTEYKKIVSRVFEKYQSRKYKDVVQEIKGAVAVGDNKAKNILTFLKDYKRYILYNKNHKSYSSNIDNLNFE